MAEGAFLEGAVRYPDELPCPQADTDLTPRERRYISDIGEVKKLRRFQSTFQATRQNISFVFTPEQSRKFREWYKYDIIEGGSWFYADWPILHKETGIAYRFVTRPIWEFLARGNYHVSATVELYERKVGKTANVFTSKLYPAIIEDQLSLGLPRARGIPSYKWTEGMVIELPRFTAVMTSPNKDNYVDDLRIPTAQIQLYLDPMFEGEGLWDEHVFSYNGTLTGEIVEYGYRRTDVLDNLRIDLPAFTGEFPRRRIQYDYYTDDGLTITLPVISEGELR